MKRSSAFLIIMILVSVSAKAQRKDTIRVYYKCLNRMAVSQLFPVYNPKDNTVKIKGARLHEFNKANKNDIGIIPDSSVVIIVLLKKNKAINQINLYSVRPPAPLIELNINGKNYYSFSTLSGPVPALLEVNLVADEAFRLTIPKDAVYRVVKWKVDLQHGSQTIKQVSLVDKISPKELADLKQEARAGDVLQIKLLSVQRQNAVGEWLDQPMARSTLLYTISN